MADEKNILSANGQTAPSSGRGEDGFTLVELLVVLAIIAMLATLVGPKVLGYLGGARNDTATYQVRNIASAVDLYFLATGRYPAKEQGLEALMTKPDGVTGWSGPYLQSRAALNDPWGHPYVYEPTGNGFVVKSLGRDGTPGGEGDDKDLANTDF